MRIQTKRDLTKGSLAQNIWTLALPLMVTSALMDIFNIVDMIFVGRLGTSAIAAVSICGVLMGLIRMLAMGISTGTVAMISRFIGEKNSDDAGAVLAQSIILSVICSAAVALLGWFFAEPVLRMLGAAEDVIPAGTEYLRIMCVFSLTMFLSMILSAGMRGYGDATTPMIAMGIASLLNIGLDPLFIFGIGPFPRLEVAGSAVATVLSRGIGTVIILFVLIFGKGDVKLPRLRGSDRFSFLGRIVQIGAFSSLRMLAMNLSRVVLIRIVAVFGTFAVAAFGIGMRLRIFVLILGFGLANATAVISGQSLGAGKPERAVKSAWLSVFYFGIFLAVMSVVFGVFPRAIIGVFNKDPDVLKYGTTFLYFFIPSLFLLDLSIVLGRAIDGAGDTKATMVVTFLALIVIGIPMAYVFSRWWGVNGIWAALVGSNMIQGVGILYWFQRKSWIHKKI